MRGKIFLVIILGTLFPNFLFAQTAKTCSKNGYTILLINGIFTTESEAKANEDALKLKMFPSFNSQPVTIDFIYNPTHSKTIDLFDVIKQKYFDQNSLHIQDYDFSKIHEDVSRKVNTQKLLLLGHSQGNFYINALYDALSDEPGGVPSMSMGIYGVASPASRISGGGKYMNSSTDKVIYGTAGLIPFTDLLPKTVDIKFKENDGDPNGHSFSKIYLAYEGGTIKRNIEEILKNLQNNSIQDIASPCIAMPERTITQEIQGAMLAVADPVLSSTEYLAAETYKLGTAIGNGIIGGTKSLASGFGDFFKSVAGVKANNTASVALSLEEETKTETNTETQSKPKAVPIPKKEETAIEAKETVPEKIEIEIKEEVVQVSEPQIVIQPAVISGGSGYSTFTPPDTTPPAITINGDNPGTIFQNSPYIDEGATALDETDGDVPVTAESDVDTSVIGTYTITYTAEDEAGNTATETRTVNVVEEDTTAPDAPIITITTEFINTDTILIIGEAEDGAVITITGGMDTALGLSEDGEFSVEVSLNQNAENILSVTATDASDNESLPSSISITHDNIAPVISRMFLPASLTYNVALVGGTLQLNIETDGSDYDIETVTINDIEVTDFFHIGGNTYGASRTVTLGETDRTSGTIPVSVVLKDKAGNTNTPFTEDEDQGLALNGQFPSSSNQVFPAVAEDGKLAEDVFLDCVTNSGHYFLYSVDEDSIFRFIGSSDLGIHCSEGKYKIMDSGEGFPDKLGYSPIAGWYYGVITIGGRLCNLGQSGQVCTQGPMQSFFRLHRGEDGVWTSDEPT